MAVTDQVRIHVPFRRDGSRSLDISPFFFFLSLVAAGVKTLSPKH